MNVLRTAAAAAATLMVGASAGATQLVLASVNSMSTGVYGDFYVQSLDLLAQCHQAGDSRCVWTGDKSPQGGSISSGEGQVDDQVMIMTGTPGGQSSSNYQSNSGPFKAAGLNINNVQVDNPFLTPGGNSPNQSNFFNMSDGEPAGAGAGEFSNTAMDTNTRWDAKLSSIVAYLGGAAHAAQSGLTILFDNNQTGADAAQYFWGQLEITDGFGNRIACYELNNTHTFDALLGTSGHAPNTQSCHNLNTWTPTFTPPSQQNPNATGGDYVSSGGGFCVNTSTGETGPAVPSGNGNNPCGNGYYYITNNLGSSTAEFAAFVPDLNSHLVAWAQAGYYMHINYQMRGLNDGNESMWIPSNQSVTFENNPAPEPAGLALVGLALAVMGGVTARRRALQG